MATLDIMVQVPKAVTAAFAAIGLLFITSKVVSYVVLLLQLFALSGTSVRSNLPLRAPNSYNITAPQIRQERLLGHHNRSF
jgi:hypothetical protein